MSALVDSNVLVYLLALASPFHQPCSDLIQRLVGQGARLYIAPQNLYEFWVQATRPVIDGGLGLNPADARLEVEDYIRQFRLLGETVLSLSDILDLAVRDGVIGRRFHDARLAALMRAHGLSDIVSYDANFDRFTGITRHWQLP